MKLTPDNLSGIFARPGQNQLFHFSLIAIIAFIALFTNLHKGDLSGFDDAVYAHEAKQMVLTGDWWNVRFNGHLNPEYPPMFLWLEALSIKLWGRSDFAAKFPAALLGFGTIILVFFIARQLSDDFWLPLWSMLILTASQFFMKYARHAMTDVPYAFFFSLTIFFYIKALKRPQYLLWCGLSIALAILTRSVIGIIPFGIIILHIIAIRRSRLFLSRYFMGGVLLAFLLPLGWYVPQYTAHGAEFLRGHFSFIFSKISSGQITAGPAPRSNFLFYPLELGKLYWPWLPLMLVGFVMQSKAAYERRDVLASLLIIWTLCVIVPFSLVAAKLLRYIIPVFPALAMLSATPLSKWTRQERKGKYLKIVYLGVCLSVLIVVAFSKPLLRAKDMSKLAPIAEKQTDTNQRTLFYSYGDPHSSYRNQFLWYANRFCVPLSDINELKSGLQADKRAVVIIDKVAFSQLSGDPVGQIEILGESENFVCFRLINEARSTDSK